MTAWRWYAGLGLGAVILGGFLPVIPRQILYSLVGASTVVAVSVGVRRHRPADRRTWWLFGAGLTCSVLGAGAWAVEYTLTGAVGFPSVKDALFLAAYPFFGGGLVSWVRRDPRRPRWERLIDSGIVASGVAALSWTFIVYPMLSSDRFDGAAQDQPPDVRGDRSPAGRGGDPDGVHEQRPQHRVPAHLRGGGDAHHRRHRLLRRPSPGPATRRATASPRRCTCSRTPCSAPARCTRRWPRPPGASNARSR